MTTPVAKPGAQRVAEPNSLPDPIPSGSNEQLAERARRVIPGGVNSSNRSLPWPMVVRLTSGSSFTDADGKTYLDYHAAFGPTILGHNNPLVNAAVQRAMDQIDLVGIGATELEIALAETLNDLVPSAERALLTNSGSEATYAALRLARAVTGRQKIVKFQGTYHGWHDAVALNVISRPDRIGHPDPLSLGMVPEVVSKTIVLPFNDADALTTTLDTRADEIAAVLVEVIPHNIGCVMPRLDFLESMRALTSKHDVVLIFDEVVTGFRHALGGYQSIVGITPDLTVFAKAMANGYPIASLVGRADLMDRFAPGSDVFFAGTYNGHPANAAAALATIGALRDGSVYNHIYGLGDMLAEGLRAIAKELGIAMTVTQFGSVVVPYFLDGPTASYEDLLANDAALDVWFRRSMCERGIFMLPTPLKRNHISAAHSASEIGRTLETARSVLASLPAAGKLATEHP